MDEEVKKIIDAIKVANSEDAVKLKAEIKTAMENALKDADAASELKLKSQKAEGETKLKEATDKLKELSDAMEALELKHATPTGFQKNSVMAELEKNSAAILKLKDDKSQNVTLSLKAVGTMTETGNYSGGIIGLSDFDPEIARIQKRKIHVRHMARVKPTSKPYIAYAEQSGQEGAAGLTAEGVKKNQIDFNIVESNKPLKKVTAFIKVSREMLDDLAYMQSEINQELVEEVNLALDTQMLNGDGTGANMSGLNTLATTLVLPAEIPADANANRYDAIRMAVAVIATDNFEATHIMLNPIDAALMSTNKTSGGDYTTPNFATANGATVAGLTVVEDNAITAGNFLIGDFSKANLAIREEVNITMGYENDDFTKNLITILAETRALLYVKTNHNLAFRKGVFADVIAELVTGTVTP